MERKGTAVVIVFEPEILPWLKALFIKTMQNERTKMSRTNFIITILKLSAAII
jgi:hypothetical protein